jgi:hypothetical protein
VVNQDIRIIDTTQGSSKIQKDCDNAASTLMINERKPVLITVSALHSCDICHIIFQQEYAYRNPSSNVTRNWELSIRQQGSYWKLKSEKYKQTHISHIKVCGDGTLIQILCF